MKIDLLAWLDAPESRRGIRFAEAGDVWDLRTWEDMARLVHEAAARIADERRERGTPVAIVLPTGPEFVAAFFGSLLVGNTPCPLAPPAPLQDPHAYSDHLAGMLRVADPALVVTAAECADLVGGAAAAAGLAREPHVLTLAGGASGREHPREEPAELALLQFTSGSSGRPRAARVSWGNLEANIEMMASWVGADVESDQLATWLPLHHDMGLIGCMLSPTVVQGETWVMRPEQFVRSPARWLACYGRHGATVGAAPTFGFAYAAKRVRDEDLEGMDFSGWRVATVGAERIDAAVLARFADRLAPYGFHPSTFVPGYGMAEATLLVTGRHAPEPAPVVRPAWDAMRFGEPVPVREGATLGDPRVGDGVGWLVSCGWAHPGATVAVVDEEGDPLPDGHLGEVRVGGRSVAQGYHGDDAVGTARFVGGELRTGDAGFRHEGELYVVGRIGDSLKVRGRSVYVEDLEARLARLDGIVRDRCALFSGAQDEGDALVALVEGVPGDWATEAARLLADEVGEAVTVHVLCGRRGSIARTSSGKPRRRVMWREWVDGTLRAQPLVTVPVAGRARPASEEDEAALVPASAVRG